MTVVASNKVALLGRAFSFGAKPALIEWTDDGRFILTTVTKKTAERLATVVDEPASVLKVRGSQSVLAITAGGVRRRIDFSFSSRGLAAFGLVGAIAGAAIAEEQGIVHWATAFERAGADVKFTTLGRSLVNALKIAGVAFGLVVVGLGIEIALSVPR